ncbi:hypothetical protein ACVWZZ_002035 [Bradyrhizobium sp. LM6.10]
MDSLSMMRSASLDCLWRELPITGIEGIAVGVASLESVLFGGCQSAGAPLARGLVCAAGDLGKRRIGIAEQDLLLVEGRLLGRRRVTATFLARSCRLTPPVLAFERRRLFLGEVLEAFRGRRVLGEHDRIEIARDHLLLILVERIDQPHDQEERHHRGHEVRIGDLPDAAVRLLVVEGAPPADDDEL